MHISSWDFEDDRKGTIGEVGGISDRCIYCRREYLFKPLNHRQGILQLDTPAAVLDAFTLLNRPGEREARWPVPLKNML